MHLTTIILLRCDEAFLLFRPLADTEKLPVRSHRAAEALKSPVEDEETPSQEPKKKSSKDKREKKDKDRERKVRDKLRCFSQEYRASSILGIATCKSRCTDWVPLRRRRLRPAYNYEVKGLNRTVLLRPSRRAKRRRKRRRSTNMKRRRTI